MGSTKAMVSKVTVKVPWVGEIEFTPDAAEKRAAWSLYVELVTRVSVEPLDEGRGVLREALSSLHGLFGATRAILKDAGPDVGRGPSSVGAIAITVLNRGLRPFLARWHSRLLVHEGTIGAGVGLLKHEMAWAEANEFRSELATLQVALGEYAAALAVMAGVERLNA